MCQSRHILFSGSHLCLKNPPSLRCPALIPIVKSRYNKHTRHKVIPRTRISFIRNLLHNLLQTCLIRITQLDTDRFLTHPTCLTQHLLIKSTNSLSYETPKPFVFHSENYNVKALTLILGKATIYIK